MLIICVKNKQKHLPVFLEVCFLLVINDFCFIDFSFLLYPPFVFFSLLFCYWFSPSSFLSLGTWSMVLRPFLLAGVKDSELEVSCSPMLGLLPTCCDVMVFIFTGLVFIFVLFEGYLEAQCLLCDTGGSLPLASGAPFIVSFAGVSSALENGAGILKTEQPACCVSYLISSAVAASVALCNAIY